MRWKKKSTSQSEQEKEWEYICCEVLYVRALNWLQMKSYIVNKHLRNAQTHKSKRQTKTDEKHESV